MEGVPLNFRGFFHPEIAAVLIKDFLAESIAEAQVGLFFRREPFLDHGIGGRAAVTGYVRKVWRHIGHGELDEEITV